MTRVLHLLGRPERELDLEASECLRVIRERLGASFEHDIRVTGASPVWTSIGLRRTLRAFDVIHAWDTRAFTAAMLAGADHVVCSTPEDAGADRPEPLPRRKPVPSFRQRYCGPRIPTPAGMTQGRREAAVF